VQRQFLKKSLPRTITPRHFASVHVPTCACGRSPSSRGGGAPTGRLCAQIKQNAFPFTTRQKGRQKADVPRWQREIQTCNLLCRTTRKASAAFVMGILCLVWLVGSRVFLTFPALSSPPLLRQSYRRVLLYNGTRWTRLELSLTCRSQLSDRERCLCLFRGEQMRILQIRAIGLHPAGGVDLVAPPATSLLYH